MAHWSLESIDWSAFDAGKVTPDIASIVKAACMVEYNGYDYARYLCEVFADDAEFQQVARDWAEEEVQHGRALRKWAELADPNFDFERSFALFTTGYKLPTNVTASVRGSRAGELVARCVVEVGTSSYYTAIKDATFEPVLKAVCAKIAADEYRHYKLFYTHLTRYLEKENIGFWKRLGIALGRITESEDDELTYAFFAAHNCEDGGRYDHARYSKLYLACAYALYRKPHIQKMTGMVMKAVGITPRRWLNAPIDQALWSIMSRRARKLLPYKNQVLQGLAA